MILMYSFLSFDPLDEIDSNVTVWELSPRSVKKPPVYVVFCSLYLILERQLVLSVSAYAYNFIICD